MKIFLVLVCLAMALISSNSQAEMFAGYDSFCGLPVVVGSDPQTASARKDQYGSKYIHVDPKAMANWSMSRMFTLAHECAHHLLGHTNRLGEIERYTGGTSKQELEADCWAANALRDIGKNSDITRTMLKYASQGHFSGGGYPSGSQRAKNILNCASGRDCRIETSQCQHPKHPGGDQVDCTHIASRHPRGDVYPCNHRCPNPYGYGYPPVPCHPRGDLFPCNHRTTAHSFDAVQCRHAAHPMGDSVKICD